MRVTLPPTLYLRSARARQFDVRQAISQNDIISDQRRSHCGAPGGSRHPGLGELIGLDKKVKYMIIVNRYIVIRYAQTKAGPTAFDRLQHPSGPRR